MPASVTASSIQDIANFYLENYMANTWADAARPYQHYITAAELFTGRRKRSPASESCTFNLKVKSADNTVPDSFFKQDTLNRADLGIKGTVKWHFQKTHFMVDAREPAMLSGSATQILDYMKMQESDMYDGFFEKNENWWWSLPAGPNDGTTGDPLPFGVPYWIVQSATAAFGFNGGVPSGYSNTVAGVNPTTYPKTKNGTFTYASVTSEDFGSKLSEAIDKTHFRAPRPSAETVPSRSTYKLYSGYSLYQDYQDWAYAANDNIGADMGKYRGSMSGDIGTQYFRGVPWCWVPALTETDSPAYDSNNPIYGINWDTFNVKSYSDFFMKRAAPIKLDDAHNTVVQWMDTGFQYYCTNRRANFVGRAA